MDVLYCVVSLKLQTSSMNYCYNADSTIVFVPDWKSVFLGLPRRLQSVTKFFIKLIEYFNKTGSRMLLYISAFLKRC